MILFRASTRNSFRSTPTNQNALLPEAVVHELQPASNRRVWTSFTYDPRKAFQRAKKLSQSGFHTNIWSLDISGIDIDSGFILFPACLPEAWFSAIANTENFSIKNPLTGRTHTALQILSRCSKSCSSWAYAASEVMLYSEKLILLSPCKLTEPLELPAQTEEEIRKCLLGFIPKVSEQAYNTLSNTLVSDFQKSGNTRRWVIDALIPAMNPL